jgi:hypothetical protein
MSCLLVNGADGISDIEGSEPDWQLAAREAASECGQRAGFNAFGVTRRTAGADAGF